jgi:DNA modification methylase
MKVIEIGKEGCLIHGAFPDVEVMEAVQKFAGGRLPLVIADPPYGNIVNEKWDKLGKTTDQVYADQMVDWTRKLEALMTPGAALYVWGGIGKPRGDKEKTPAFRPFYRYLLGVEDCTNFRLSSHITWKKKRAYGIQWGYLFTREECAYFILGDVKKPRKFNVPLLEEKRGYAGYDKNHPAKSEFFRRTNVWDDIEVAESSMDEKVFQYLDFVMGEIKKGRNLSEIFIESFRSDIWSDVTEILRGKVHEAQKPLRVMEIPIEVHTDPGETVLDPFAGSGTTGHAARRLERKFVLVEKDPEIFEKMRKSFR